MLSFYLFSCFAFKLYSKAVILCFFVFLCVCVRGVRVQQVKALRATLIVLLSSASELTDIRGFLSQLTGAWQAFKSQILQHSTQVLSGNTNIDSHTHTLNLASHLREKERNKYSDVRSQFIGQNYKYGAGTDVTKKREQILTAELNIGSSLVWTFFSFEVSAHNRWRKCVRSRVCVCVYNHYTHTC